MYYIVTIHHTDGTRTQFASIFKLRSAAETASRFGVYKKETASTEVKAFQTLGEIKRAYPSHRITRYRNGAGRLIHEMYKVKTLQ